MSYQIELRHLRYFVAVADELHFRKAAEKLYISQPGLSRQIKQMEEGIGFQLFERNNKQVILTPAGEYLKDELKIILKNIGNATEHARLMSEGKTGKIKMGYVGSAMQSIIPDLLVKFNSEFPDIKFGLMQLDNAQQIDSLLDHELDVGFVRLNQVPKNLKIKPIWKETFSIVLPKKHPLTQRKFKSISQLQNDPFILFEKEYSPVYYERVMSIFEDAGFSPNISHTSVHAQTIFRLVENNFGFSIVPTSLKSGFDMEVKFIELKNISQKATLFLTWNSSNRNPCLEKFLKMVD